MRFGAVCFVMAAALVAGCEGGELESDAQLPGDTAAEDSIPGEDALAAPEPGTLMPINQSGIRGNVEIDEDEDEVEGTVEVEGLDNAVTYSAGLHEGRCAAGGALLVLLGDLTAEADGSGSLEFEVATPAGSGTTQRFVQLETADGQPVACADLAAEEQQGPIDQGGDGG